MAGGIGSRFWPFSRTDRPKQFLDFFGTGKSLLQMTVDRFRPLVPIENIFIVTNVAYKNLILEQIPDLDEDQILCEPARRNTAPCIAYATTHIKMRAKGVHANVVVAASDHLILEEEKFRQTIQTAFHFVNENNAILTLGMQPTRPETGYGYMQIDDDRQVGECIYPVKSFTEKPNEDFAKIFLQEGNFYWNTGLFCFNVDVMLRKLYDLVPEYQVEIPRMMAEAEFADPKSAPDFFSRLPNLNIDVSILEKSNNVYMQQGHFEWADLGTWASIYDDTPADEEGNVLLNTKAYLYESQNNIIRLPKGRTAVVKGLNDYVIAEEGEILMICPRADVAAMRKMHTDTKFS